MTNGTIEAAKKLLATGRHQGIARATTTGYCRAPLIFIDWSLVWNNIELTTEQI